MIRFIHTADWQIGMKAAGLGSVSQDVRDARLESVQGIVDLGHERGVKLLLVAGDVFEDNAVDRSLVREIGEKLRKFRGEVFIIPGNHDPLKPGSVWDHEVWGGSGNVTVIQEAKPIELDNCTLFPSPVKKKYSTQNPVSWIQAKNCDKIAIGLAHGSVNLPDSDYYPIPANAAEQAGLDYLGIGHLHSYKPYKDSKGAIRMAYSGTHETTKFGESDSGKVLLVEIADRGAAPKLEPIAIGKLKWITLNRDIKDPDELKRIIKDLDSIESPDDTLVRLRLEGFLSFSSQSDLIKSLEEILSTHFLYGELSNELSPAPKDNRWIDELPRGPVQKAARTIRKQALSGADEREKKVATRALLELFELNNKEKANS
ncbi:MAG: putative metallophosphoesterase YhaO [Verrucomicrobia subdivision 3 bacterium]|nr:putative metallophosphoesterase YhaO [Limisphaerales bacterium]MCS1413675.1 putative metallophosphoesterase YhaO [Limisphaerales bacterium]